MFIFHIGVFGLGLRMDVSQLKHFTKRNDCLVTLPICSDFWLEELVEEKASTQIIKVGTENGMEYAVNGWCAA